MPSFLRHPLLLLTLPLAFALSPAIASSSPAAEPLTFRSGPAAVDLLELYTSEGCSSCPPAERWFGGLIGDPRLWREFVPVAFHVTYWDHLGWRDPFGNPGHADRQRAYADAWSAGTIYTPGFVRAGREWRRDAEPIPTKSPPRDVGSLMLERTADGAVTLRFTPGEAASAARPSYEASLALLGGGIVSKVLAGENAGRSLEHEFVVLRLDTATLTADPAAPGTHVATFAAPPALPAGIPQPTRRALAAWVSAPRSPSPLQAVGGWLPRLSPLPPPPHWNQ